MSRVAVALVALVVWFGLEGISAAATRTVAVSYFDNTSNDPALDPLRKGLADMLITDLSNVTSLRIVEREKLESLVKEIKLGRGAFFDPKTAQKLGRGLGAELVLTGSYFVAGEELRIDVRLVKVETGEIVAADKAQGLRADFFDIEKELVDLLVTSLDLKLERAEKRAIGERPTRSFDAVKAYSAGLDARDAGDEAKAAEAFRAALAADPDYRAAKDALGRLRVLLQRESNAATDELAELESRSKQPGFGQWLSDLLQRIGFTADTRKYRQRLTVLKFLVERDLRPSITYPGQPRESFVEPNALYAWFAAFSMDPDYVEELPAVFEYLYLKYPADPSFAAWSAQVPMLEQAAAKVRDRRARLDAVKEREATGELFITEERDANDEEKPCRRLPIEIRDFGNSLRLLGETTSDAARLETWAAKYEASYLQRMAALCTSELDLRIASGPLDSLAFQVASSLAQVGDAAGVDRWFAKLKDQKTFAASKEGYGTIISLRRPVLETRRESLELLRIVKAKAAQLGRSK